MMKRLLFLTLMLVSAFAMAQAPQGFSYQAVLRNGSGSPIANKTVAIRVTLQNASQVAYYSETHTKMTNSQGVASIIIGSGTQVSGNSFSSIPWSNGDVHLKIEIDPDNGINFTAMGDATKLQSVPYSLFAPNGMPTNGTTGQTLYHNGTTWTPSNILVNDGTNIGVGSAIFSPTQKLDVNGAIRLRGLLYDYNNTSGLTNQILTRSTSGVLWQSPSGMGIPTGAGVNNQLAVWSGTNSVKGVTNLTWGTSLQVASLPTAGIDDAIFEVKNKDGKVVFGVYQGGVVVNFDDSGVKGARGGFAVGGLSQTKAGTNPQYFRITMDSARIYLKDVAKGARGGFAVGGLSQTKGFSNYMQLNSDNYFIGQDAGKSINKGQYNVFIGYQAGMNTTGYHQDMEPTDGDNNIFLGYHAGYSNTVGEQNIYMGAFSGEMNDNGSSNTYLGSESGRYNKGYGNTLIGAQTGGANQTNNTGYKNTFIGHWSGTNNTTGNGNVFIGRECGSGNTTGYNNVYIGHLAGNNNSTGYGNVFIGPFAGWYSNQNNTLIIHNNGDALANIPSNSLIYGDFSAKTLRLNATVGINTAPGSVNGLNINAGISTNAASGVYSIGNYMGVWGIASGASTASYRYGVYGSASGGTYNYGVSGYAAIAANSYAGYFSGNVNITGTLYVNGTTYSSDKRLKKNIKPLESSLTKVMNLQGVTYNWKSETELSDIKKSSDPNIKENSSKFNFPTGTQIGVIAQDVEKIFPELVNTDGDGLKSVDYVKFTPILIEAIKEQQKKIEQLEEKVKEVDALKAELEAIKALLKK